MLPLFIAVREESQASVPAHPRRGLSSDGVRDSECACLHFGIQDKVWTARIYSTSFLKQLLHVKDLVQRLKSAKIDENVRRTYESSSSSHTYYRQLIVNQNHNSDNNLCLCCGGTDHWVKECPKSTPKYSYSDNSALCETRGVGKINSKQV